MRRPRPTRRHFYPRSPCGERLVALPGVDFIRVISIHVPLAGNVSPTLSLSSVRVTFLSTFPLRGTSSPLPPAGGGQISIHVPLAGNVHAKEICDAYGTIFLSTFPLRGTSSADICAPLVHQPRFLSTFPLRGTSHRPPDVIMSLYISIHVPLAGNVCQCIAPSR